MKKIAIIFCALLGLATSKSYSQNLASPGSWESGMYQEMPYRILMPDHYDSNKKYPLVLFLHGIGERGTDNQAQLINGVELFNNADYRERYPAIIVVPQCPKPYYEWTHFPYRENKLPRQALLAISIAKNVAQAFAVDPKRIYVTGISMGGSAAWDFIVRYNDFFAAALPVSGMGDIYQSNFIAQTPIWAFHNSNDFVISTMFDRKLYDEMQMRGGLMKYTEYHVWGHDAWTQTYHNTIALDWLFAQRRK